MSGYRRFVAYVYEYHKGKKESNCGFIKVEARDMHCRMEVHLHCPGLTPQVECKIYGFIRNAGLMDGILLGICETGEGKAECVIETDAQNMGESGVSLGRLGGIILKTESGAFFGTEWDDQIIRPDNFRELRIGQKKDKTEMMETSKLIKQKQAENPEEIKSPEEGSEKDKTDTVQTIDAQSDLDKNSETEVLQESGREMEVEAKLENEFKKENNTMREAEKINQDFHEAEGPELETQSVNSREMQMEQPDTDSAPRLLHPLASPMETNSFSSKEKPPEIRSSVTLEEPPEICPSTTSKADSQTTLTNGAKSTSKTGPETDSAPDSGTIQPRSMMVQNPDRNTSHPPRKMNANRNTSRPPMPSGSGFNCQHSARAKTSARTSPRQPAPIAFGEPCIPFQDGEIINCRKIHPKDLAHFSRKDCTLRNNRFLLYGYYNFGHLLVGTTSTGRYILGVPGGYDQQERFMANMFGFPYFKECKQIELPKGKGGYWYRSINAPDIH